MQLTEAISNYIDKRLEPLEKLLEHHPEHTIDVEVGKTTNHHKSGDIFRAEVNLHIKEKTLRAVSEMVDLYAAIDTVKDEISAALKSHISRKRGVWKRGAQKIKEMARGYITPFKPRT